MDFFRSIIDSQRGEDGDGIPKEDISGIMADLNKAVDEGREVMLDVRRQIIASCEGYHQKGKYGSIIASAKLFTIIWLLVGWAWRGIRTSYRKDGSASPVWRMWKLFEATFGAADPDEATARLAKIVKEFGDE